MPSDNDKLQQILDNLATTIHNLSPGDVGSMDRVLVPIDHAKAAIQAWHERQLTARLQAILDSLPEPMEVEDAGYEIPTDPLTAADQAYNKALEQVRDIIKAHTPGNNTK